ncbi:hypothetical protein FRACYDRAFT_246399 [Fragilariopsis cylindrus CCMP1102]|uniref:MYND-type domain-containing protein n=1 Tax=Fragilariopsis cylindrus CCMP1102 TaxID=635003 RepID=A0A1E7EZQ5_9STRA|nr:hypothetical protein FRACYDRAFT_246399 [Fragilariopsis cylindrus CCMP1102]|eukprot:OEU11285.1 hypothetical protein FRACYDRAFT_246399 [Fragilariopsis cylindrus CCMP1102]
MGKKSRRTRNKKTGNDAASAIAIGTATKTTFAITTVAEAEAGVKAAGVANNEKGEELDNQLPKSEMYVQAMAGTDSITTLVEQFRLWNRGITENDCVHCMFIMGLILGNPSFVRCTHAHAALPWHLEGAIRGGSKCTMNLIRAIYISKADPNRKTAALMDYWGKISKKYFCDVALVDTIELKNAKSLLVRECIICSKTDTKTFTLQQCQGCSVYCYCSEACQTKHWNEYKHRNECKQVQILNKYHKPYAKKIRDAVIRGDKENPSLEKLRYKLGLTRPDDDSELLPINPDDYLVGREDGTVWVGSDSSYFTF